MWNTSGVRARRRRGVLALALVIAAACGSLTGPASDQLPVWRRYALTHRSDATLPVTLEEHPALTIRFLAETVSLHRQGMVTLRSQYEYLPTVGAAYIVTVSDTMSYAVVGGWLAFARRRPCVGGTCQDVPRRGPMTETDLRLTVGEGCLYRYQRAGH